ncbi:CPBP family intramembrane glutamic endopeptidase [Saccharopolyspora sp. MS10]|uniref:CPBP family intramembrane glutamic endopeptidase n=1 Tax=Saccharopolyspora sp. MS10 TaxID=3385973 RepID=UPI0039A2D337
MARWKALVAVLAAPLILLVTQFVVFQAVVAIEGPADPDKPALTPLTIAATGVSTALTAVITTAMVTRMAKVPWRAVFRHNRRFDRRRLGAYLGASACLVGLSTLASALIAPESTGWGEFGLNASSASVIVATLLFTPLQSAGEEVAFRGAVVPAAGSWLRGTRYSIAAGVVTSWIIFAAIHVTLDPWFIGYMFVFSACTASMGLITGGIEAAMAFHVSNNVLVGIVNALFAGDDVTVVDRAAGSGPGAALIILMVMNVAVTLTVWAIERRRRARVPHQAARKSRPLP